MPRWCELSTAEREQAIADRARGVDWPVIYDTYGISNTESAGRKIRNALARRGIRPSNDAAPTEPTPRLPPTPPDRIDDVRRTFIEYQHALQAFQDSRAKDHIELEIDDDKPIGLAMPADRHLGDMGTDHELQWEHARLLAGTPGMYVIEGGDAVTNYIHPKINEVGRSDVPPDAQYAMYRQLLELLHPLCVAHGNHDTWTEKFSGVDMLAEIAAKVQTVCTSEGAEIDITVGGVRYVIYRQHRGRYNSSFNLTHSVKRMWDMGPCDFDMGVIDHQHVPAAELFYKHGTAKLAIRSGSYKTKDEWAKRQGFYGSRIGVPIVFLWPGEKRFQLWPSVDDVAGACSYLRWLRG